MRTTDALKETISVRRLKIPRTLPELLLALVLVAVPVALLSAAVPGTAFAQPQDTLRAADTLEAPRDAISPPDAPSPDDAALEARLQRVLDAIPAFEQVTVAVRSGVVRLEGTVVDAQDVGAVAEVARGFDGVVYVVNEVTSETAVADRVSPAVERLQEYVTGLVDFLPVGAIALAVLLVTVWASRLVGGWRMPTRVQVSPLAWGLIRRVMQGAVALVGLLMVFDLLGVTSLVGAVLGTAGVAGLAIGFAFQDIIENYLAGVLLSLRQPFRVNDVISVADQQGRVVRLTARELVLLTVEGNHVRLPNATVFKSVLTNYTLNPNRLFFFDVGVGVNEDLADAQRIGVETLDAMAGVLPEPPPFARVQSLADSSVAVRFYGWVNQKEADFFKVQSEAIRLVKTALDDAHIDMPEPTFRLQLYDAGPLGGAGADAGGDAADAADAGKPTIAEQAAAADVAPDGRLDAQVEAEARRSGERNLLDEDGRAETDRMR